MNWFTLGAEPFPDAVVSFWRVDEQNEPETLLYVGALIKPNWILVPSGFFLPPETLKNIRIHTGPAFKNAGSILDKSKNVIDFKILGKIEIPLNDRFIILVVSTSA